MGAPSGPSGDNSSKKRCGEKSTARVVESRLGKGSSIWNSLAAASVSRAVLSIPSRNPRVLLIEPSGRKYTMSFRFCTRYLCIFRVAIRCLPPEFSPKASLEEVGLLDGSENTKTPYETVRGVMRARKLLWFGFWVEAECGRVDAVAPVVGRPVLEDVSLVGAADGAVYLSAAHEEAPILFRLDVCFVEWLPEARPARTGIVLGGRREEGVPQATQR